MRLPTRWTLIRPPGRNWVVNPVTPTIQDFVWHADWLPYERLLSQSLVDTDRWVHALQLTTATNARATLVQANDEPNVMNLIVDIDPQSPGVDSVLTAHHRVVPLIRMVTCSAMSISGTSTMQVVSTRPAWSPLLMQPHVIGPYRPGAAATASLYVPWMRTVVRVLGYGVKQLTVDAAQSSPDRSRVRGLPGRSGRG